MKRRFFAKTVLTLLFCLGLTAGFTLGAQAANPIVYTKPGFVNPDGSLHPIPRLAPFNGKTINVKDFGVDLADSDFDDAPGLNKALDSAEAGDTVYLPKGVYNLKTGSSKDRYANLSIKSGVRLLGESREGVVLVSSFTPDEFKKFPTKVIRLVGVENVEVSSLSISAVFDPANYSDNSKSTNSKRSGPLYSIFIEDQAGVNGRPSNHVLIDNVYVERFQRMGVRIAKSYNVIVRKSVFKNATDVGGGGAGYGVCIQGEGWEKNRNGYDNDTRYNLVEDCEFYGPYLRHGMLIQYYAHNNLVRNNKFDGLVLDAIDLHGEDEYLNEIHGNYLANMIYGAGIGVGNTGATHDKAGPGNYIHHNTIVNSREGIKVYMGSPDTLIEANIITDFNVAESKGIYLLNAPNTIVKDNSISGGKGANFWGIVIENDVGDSRSGNPGRGSPENIQLLGNVIKDSVNGIAILDGKDIVLKANKTEGLSGIPLKDLVGVK